MIDPHTHNLLLTLSHLWLADAEQLRRLHFPSLALATVQNRLTGIKDRGLIASHAWSIEGVRQRSLWGLTVKGQRAVASDPAYAGKPPDRSAKLYNHDRRCVDAIVRLLEIARRSGLAGAQVLREVRLELRTPKPKADAILFMETRQGAASIDTIPWSTTLPVGQVQLWRVAIESDTGSQAVAVVRDKAMAYRALYDNPAWVAAWRERHGPPPSIYLVTTTPERAAQIATAWREAWPGGTWGIAGDEGLAANRWHYQHGGQGRPAAALRFRSPEEIAADNARAAEQEKTAKEARAQAERQRIAKERADLDARAPRPLEELTRLHRWRPNQETTFRPDGGINWLWAGSLRQTEIRFNAAEEMAWREYERGKLDEAAELERRAELARAELARQQEAAKLERAKKLERQQWWAGVREQAPPVLMMLVLLSVTVYALANGAGAEFGEWIRGK